MAGDEDDRQHVKKVFLVQHCANKDTSNVMLILILSC